MCQFKRFFQNKIEDLPMIFEVSNDFFTDIIQYASFFSETFLSFIGLSFADRQHCLSGQGMEEVLVILAKYSRPAAFKVEHADDLSIIENRYIKFCYCAWHYLNIEISPGTISM